MSIENKSNQFIVDFHNLVDRALNEKVHIGTVIMTIDQAKFELQTLLLTIKQNQQAEAAMNKILPANGKVPPFQIPPPRG